MTVKNRATLNQMKKTKKKEKKVSQNKYSVTLKIGDKLFVGRGMTQTEALGNLPKPDKIMAKGVVTIKDGDFEKQMLLQPAKIKSLFYNSRGVQEIIAKQLFMLMK